MSYIWIFLFFLFLLIIIYYYAIYSTNKEGYTNPNEHKNEIRCPNLLVQKHSKFFLYNTNLAEVPGVNPIVFENLEDYTEFIDWQRAQGIRCPILFVQHTYDAQGKTVYKSRPSVHESQGGLQPSNKMPISIASSGKIIESPKNDQVLHPNPTLLVDAGRNDPPYNKNSYPAYDNTSYYVGTTTPLDKMDIDQEKKKVSPNPMDTNWGGHTYTQTLVDRGYYKNNYVYIPT
jgi:hypothetical protein